jgi:hypothetical protein
MIKIHLRYTKYNFDDAEQGIVMAEGARDGVDIENTLHYAINLVFILLFSVIGPISLCSIS